MGSPSPSPSKELSGGSRGFHSTALAPFVEGGTVRYPNSKEKHRQKAKYLHWLLKENKEERITINSWLSWSRASSKLPDTLRGPWYKMAAI